MNPLLRALRYSATPVYVLLLCGLSTVEGLAEPGPKPNTLSDKTRLEIVRPQKLSGKNLSNQLQIVRPVIAIKEFRAYRGRVRDTVGMIGIIQNLGYKTSPPVSYTLSYLTSSGWVVARSGTIPAGLKSEEEELVNVTFWLHDAATVYKLDVVAGNRVSQRCLLSS